MNCSLRMAYWPSVWRQAKVIEIPKPRKDLNLVGSYRPIALLSSTSKIFKKTLAAKCEHLTVMPNFQFGFRPRLLTAYWRHGHPRSRKGVWNDLPLGFCANWRGSSFPPTLSGWPSRSCLEGFFSIYRRGWLARVQHRRGRRGIVLSFVYCGCKFYRKVYCTAKQFVKPRIKVSFFIIKNG